MEDNINTKNKEERDWEKTGIKVLDMAKQELFLGMRYMFLALNMLGYKADRRIRFVATDGSFLYYNPVLLIENYKKNPTDVNRAYLHMIMHCLFRHIYDAEKYKDEDDIQLWNLSCDICAEYLVDGIELSCVIKPENTKRQQIYKEILYCSGLHASMHGRQLQTPLMQSTSVPDYSSASLIYKIY